MTHGKVTVLAYHRIDTPSNPATADLSPSLIDAYPPEFAAQMRWLAGHYNVISGQQLVDAVQGKKALPSRAVMITFDDGYSCFLSTAVPILRRYGLPATLFVATEYASKPTQPFWWDTVYRSVQHSTRDELTLKGHNALPLRTPQERAAAYEALVQIVESSSADNVQALVEEIAAGCGITPSRVKQRLDWDELGVLAEAGDISVGPHTRRHPILSRTGAAAMKDEIEGSWADLEARIAHPLPVLAYPNGQMHAITRASALAVRKAGLSAAFTMLPGHNKVGHTNPYMMHRIGAVPGLSTARFQVLLSPLGEVLRRGKAAVRRRLRAP